VGLACCRPAYAEVTQTIYFCDAITPQFYAHFLILTCTIDTSYLVFFYVKIWR